MLELWEDVADVLREYARLTLESIADWMSLVIDNPAELVIVLV